MELYCFIYIFYFLYSGVYILFFFLKPFFSPSFPFFFFFFSSPSSYRYDNEPFLKWLTNVAANATIPDIFTISYQDFEDTLSSAFMQRVSTEAAQLAVRGTTLVTGSGDWGVGCSADGKLFRPDFPSSSPYVVSTGATTFSGPNPTPAPGAEVGITFSSGGFSNTFAQPTYQSVAVEAFLSSSPVPEKYFNKTGQ